MYRLGKVYHVTYLLIFIFFFSSSNWNNTRSLSSEHLQVLGQFLDMVVLERHEAE
jgi:hypothetical protein